MQLQVIEFFAGIGGVARALEGIGDIVSAYDINENAALVYRSNFDHPYSIQSIESLSADDLTSLNANTWWLSAPCQPFTRRGLQRDERDRRTAALRSLLQVIDHFPPTNVCLENVVGFEKSNMRSELVEVLTRNKFHWVELQICPTSWGIPNQRPRYYMLASQRKFQWVMEPSPQFATSNQLAPFLDTQVDNELGLAPDVVKKYIAGLNVVEQQSNVTNCFTSGYGKSMTKSGSYLCEPDGSIRRFSPMEVSKLLGFWGIHLDKEFVLPTNLTMRQQWKLLGNSVSVFVVRELLSRFASALNVGYGASHDVSGR